MITSLGLFIWHEMLNISLFFLNCCSWKIWTKVHATVGERELSNSVVVHIHQEKNTFIHVSWINPFFKLQIHCVLNGMIKMDKLIVLLVSQQVLLPLKSVIFVSTSVPVLSIPTSCPPHRVKLHFYFGQHYHTWLSQQFMAFKNRGFRPLLLLFIIIIFQVEKANLLFL